MTREKTSFIVQSELTGSERVLQEMDFEIMKNHFPIRKDGRHFWSRTKLMWQACLTHFYEHGKHTWSSK